jgi:hypothetical protein
MPGVSGELNASGRPWAGCEAAGSRPGGGSTGSHRLGARRAARVAGVLMLRLCNVPQPTWPGLRSGSPRSPDGLRSPAILRGATLARLRPLRGRFASRASRTCGRLVGLPFATVARARRLAICLLAVAVRSEDQPFDPNEKPREPVSRRSSRSAEARPRALLPPPPGERRGAPPAPSEGGRNRRAVSAPSRWSPSSRGAPPRTGCCSSSRGAARDHRSR